MQKVTLFCNFLFICFVGVEYCPSLDFLALLHGLLTIALQLTHSLASVIQVFIFSDALPLSEHWVVQIIRWAVDSLASWVCPIVPDF